MKNNLPVTFSGLIKLIISMFQKKQEVVVSKDEERFAFDWLQAIILSCENQKHIRCCKRLIVLYRQKYPDSELASLLEDLIYLEI